MAIELIVGFVIADLALIVSPGPDWIYVLTRGIGHGRQVALWSVVGVCLGYLGHTILVVAGLAALITASTTAFTTIRVAGALYIIYLGIRLLITRTNPFGTTEASEPPSPRSAVAQGAWTSGLNPKGLLLYFAVLPQFITANSTISPTLQLAALGLLHVLGCAAIYGALAAGSGAIGNRLQKRPTTTRRIQHGAGLVLTVLGGKLLADTR